MSKLNQTPLRRYKQGKASAKRRRLAFNLSYKTYLTKLKQGCVYCGIDLLSVYSGIGLDRLNHRYGYTDKNTAPCCGDCNSLRSDQLTPEETKMMVDFLRSLRYIEDNKPVWKRRRYKRR